MNKRPFTPSEINKFSYCNYQWYYERKYGKRELRRMGKENAIRRGEPTRFKEREVNLSKGQKYHEKHYEKIKKRRFYIFLILFAIIALLASSYIGFQYMQEI